MVIVGLRPSAADHEEQHRLAENLVRDMVLRYFGLSSIVFQRDANGKPQVKGHPEISFSVSHSGHLVGCALRVPSRDPFPTPFPNDFPSILLSKGFGQAEFALTDEETADSIGFDMEKFRSFDEHTIQRFYARYFSDVLDLKPSSDRLVFLWTRLESKYKHDGSWNGRKPSVKGSFFSGRWIYLGDVYYFSICLRTEE